MSLFTSICPECGDIATMGHYSSYIQWVCSCGYEWIEDLDIREEREQ